MSISLLCWGAVFSLLWEKRRTLNLESDLFSSLLGLFIVSFVLLRSWFITKYDSFFEFTPLLSGLGVALLASGVKGLGQYWRELAIIVALNTPLGFLTDRIDITTLTAKFSTSVLYYLGFAVSRQGIFIYLPTGSVEVVHGCSGIESIVQLLRLALLFLVIFPTGLAQKILVPVAAVLVAFLVNGVRIALMALLVASSNQEAFEYWHTGSGSQVYFLISTLLFGWFCYSVSPKNEPDEHEPKGLSGS